MQIVIRRALEKARMQKAFRHYMAELEHQVEERTRNLAEANIHLEQSMEELRSTQEQLIQAEKFCALGEATAVVAPKLGESLAMIVGFAQVLAKITPAESRMKAQLEQLGDMAFHCHEIVSNLADFPWKQSPQKVQTQLNDCCEQMLAGLAYQTDLSKIVVHRRLDTSLPPNMVDPQQLLQAFMNIALNACRTITSYRDGGRLTVETKQTGGGIQVAIHVGGLEIANGRHNRLLEPFLPIREDSGGLGLSFAYRRIKEHGGKMAVHNIPGEGVTYGIELPIREPMPLRAGPLSNELESIGRHRVLIVDADEKSLALLHEIVRHLGHDADEGSSAQQG
jgi:two-component system, NtrC family, sensor histidine kinase HydH